MKPQSFLTIALVVSASIAGFGNSAAAQDRRVRLQMLRTAVPAQAHLTVLERAYLDTAGILNQPSSCSQFFGGTESRKVLDELVMRLREHSINDCRTGVRMSGLFADYVDSESGVFYRLFAEAELNTGGPFYKAKVFPAEPFVPNVGSFRPNTREARVLILLHELAHLIKGRDGTWLIPDDGGNPQLSRQNTRTVETQCGQQIRALQ
ncbi:MAG TPA: hypothetical protein VGJ55_02685 [Pyrinomonadaceae bacterium]